MPVLLAARRRVPREDERDRPVRPLREVLEHGHVVGVGHPLDGAREAEPFDPVDLVIRDERGTVIRDERGTPVRHRAGCGPVVHDLWVAGRQVPDGPEPTAEHRADARLLGHLADSRLRELLPRVTLAFGQRPVAAPRAMNEQYFRAVGAAPPHDGPGGHDLPGLPGRPVATLSRRAASRLSRRAASRLGRRFRHRRRDRGDPRSAWPGCRAAVRHPARGCGGSISRPRPATTTRCRRPSPGRAVSAVRGRAPGR